MAITYATDQQVTNSARTFTYDNTKEFLVVAAHASFSSNTGSSVPSVTITDGSGNVLTLTIDRQEDESASWPGAATKLILLASGKPASAVPSALVSGTCTLDMTPSGTLSSWQASVIECDMGTSVSHPFRDSEYVFSDASIDPFTAFTSMAVESGGFGIITSFHRSGTIAAVGAPWTEQFDSTGAGYRHSLNTADFASSTSYAPQLDPSAAAGFLALFAWYKEVNDPSLTDVDTLPATPGETMTLAGTALDAANSGVRIRMVSTPTAYDALTSYSASSSIAATANMPSMLTEVPFTVGTSQTVEFVSTASGVASGVPFAGSLDVASGYAVVELLTPNTTASESVAANFGVTPAALDQLYYQTDSGNVVIADSGVPTAGPSYVAGTQLNAYLWDASASSGRWLGPIQFQLTDDGSVVAAGDGFGGVLRSPIRSPIDSGIIH